MTIDVAADETIRVSNGSPLPRFTRGDKIVSKQFRMILNWGSKSTSMPPNATARFDARKRQCVEADCRLINTQPRRIELKHHCISSIELAWCLSYVPLGVRLILDAWKHAGSTE